MLFPEMLGMDDVLKRQWDSNVGKDCGCRHTTFCVGLSIWKDVETIVLNANGTMQVTSFCRLRSPFNASQIYLLGCLCTRRGQKDCWFNYPDDL